MPNERDINVKLEYPMQKEVGSHSQYWSTFQLRYLSFEAKEDNATSSPITGRRGLNSSELRTDEEFDFDFDFAFEFGLERSLDLLR